MLWKSDDVLKEAVGEVGAADIMWMLWGDDVNTTERK